MQEIFGKVEALKSENKKIVFTNGCFDVLHAGHVRYLEFCKHQGDVLIVAINSDTSVSRLKGQNRPINNFGDRAYIISKLEQVDFTIGFCEDTPESLVKILKPDILIKGGDYKNSHIAGSDFVLSYGGRVICSPTFGHVSSTSIIEKLGLNSGH